VVRICHNIFSCGVFHDTMVLRLADSVGRGSLGLELENGLSGETDTGVLFAVGL
jgi:hypothetical protein